MIRRSRLPLLVGMLVVLAAIAAGRLVTTGQVGPPEGHAATPAVIESPTPDRLAVVEPTAAGTPVATVPPAPAPTATPTPPPAPSPTPSPTPALPPEGQTAMVPVLMYHYVRPDPGPSDPVGQDLSVTPERFAAQMAWLAAHGYTTMTLRELAAVRAGQLRLPEKPIVLTFDDGYRDFYSTAFPILREHHMQATLFVITGVVDQPSYVTWDMIAEMDASGLVEIGSHTVNHVELPSVSDAEAAAELTRSKAALEAHLGRPVTSFCYPVGRANEHTAELVRSAGYAITVTTQGGWARAEQDSELLPRVRIHGATTLDEFAAMLE